MDLQLVAHQMRLDAFAVRVSRCLSEASVQHALLKGPTTARWLYTPPRLYRDVDVLVSLDQLDDAVAALQRAGLATPAAGSVGEGASHSQVLVSADGIELDVHVTLPLLPALSEKQLSVLWEHLEPFAVDDLVVPALDSAARGLVLALHALGSTADSQAEEDLRRARRSLGPIGWRSVDDLAHELGIAPLVAASVDLLEGRVSEGELPLQVRLLRRGAASAYQINRLLSSRRSSMVGDVWREIVPSRGFMEHVDGRSYPRSTSLNRARLRRVGRLLTTLPGQVRLLMTERRSDRRSR